MFQNCICYPVIIGHEKVEGGIPGTLLVDRHANKPYEKGEVCTAQPLPYHGTYTIEYSTNANAEVDKMVIAAEKNGTHEHCHRYIVKLL